MEDVDESAHRQAQEEERKTLKARKDLADAERRAEQARAKAIRAESKAHAKEMREKRRADGATPKISLAPLTSLRHLVPLALIAVIAAVAIVIFPVASCASSQPEATVITTSDLERMVNISKLSSAEFVYNGIAQAIDENGNIQYSVAYCATVRAGIDMSQITFDIDDENRTVTPILPEIIIEEPILDETSLDFMPSNPRADLRDIIALCKADALSEVQEDGQVTETARENLKSTIEALISPLLEHNNYTLVWEDGTVTPSEDSDSSQNAGNSSSEEADTNE